jgi:hypothetical protein
VARHAIAHPITAIIASAATAIPSPMLRLGAGSAISGGAPLKHSSMTIRASD